MEHDSSRSGYHEPVPGSAGQQVTEDWGDDVVKTFSVNLIWACASDMQGRPGAMGFKGGMPWHLAEDMRRFKELTVSHPVIMGRKTWDSLNPKFRPLPNRDNIVVTRDPDFRAAGATTANSMEAALDFARQEAIPDDGLDRSEIWVIGGAQIFREVMPFANKAYVTYIRGRFDADTYAPDMDALTGSGAWSVVDDGLWMSPKKAEQGVQAYRFATYRKNR
ncbi:dihydrofolate reductase [Bifidobacterium sp. ESL0763]|uniref:dihydrofolate reductase n=1 Tax=Bifidobacterium sp. ESL0763 TaxID=2983227 RepID=UPI0023F975A2|nr:dihydrofolate reductase [Bifidobacterium sp. ESL0763]MDF7663514.1 dihydrofolate reductase [Bifidobacterium sp. ESL0763]